MLEIVFAAVLVGVVALWPKLKQWQVLRGPPHRCKLRSDAFPNYGSFLRYIVVRSAAFQALGELNQDPDKYYAKWRRTKPYLDVAVPILPRQTYIMDYPLARKFYGNTVQLPYEMIKRQMDYHAFRMPKGVIDDTVMRKAITQIELMFHKEMSSQAVDEIMPRFNSFAMQELQHLQKTVDLTKPIPIQDVLYRAMVNISVPTFWGDGFPLEGLPEELQGYDSGFSAVCLAGQLSPFFRVLLQKTACREAFAWYAALVDRVAQYRRETQLSSALSIVNQMDTLLANIGWSEEEIGIGHASMIFALTTNASDAASLIIMKYYLHPPSRTYRILIPIWHSVIQSPRLHAKIMEEIKALPKLDDGQPDYGYDNMMKKLPHLKSAIHETLRLRTNVISARIAKEDCQVVSDEHVVNVKKDRTVLLPVRALHTDERVWEKPFTFNGARFLGDNESKAKDLYFFGAGTSRCSGRVFAIAEMLAISAQILSLFDFDVASAYIQRNGVKVEPETFAIDDLGESVQGFWPGRSNIWKANNAGVMRSNVSLTYGLSDVMSWD